MSALADQFIQLGALALKLGEVERATMHLDLRPETDTTHTVMLVWVACCLAERHGLDAGLVAQLAAVHDAPEAHAGDVQTLRISKDQRRAKEGAEQAATVEIHKAFRREGTFWFSDLLAVYRQQVVREARFVRVIDKLLPKLTHLGNGGAAIRRLGMGREEFLRRMAAQDLEIAEYAGEFSEALTIRAELIGKVAALLPSDEAALPAAGVVVGS